MTYRQGNPYCIQIEPTEGCNLRCPFCGINGIRGEEKTYNFMTIDTATRIADEMARLKWNSRIEIAMHGEPTMNPNINEIISIFRARLPKAYILMESNGGPLIKNPSERISELFVFGLSTLALDEYQQVNYPACGKAGNPHQRNTAKRIVRVRPVDLSSSGTHSSLSNHCGAGLPLNDRAKGHRCAKPFREISVRWDGAVTICCNDWRGVMPVGNVNDRTLDEIWHDERFYAMRRKLYHGQRDVGACIGCDYKSYRPGILPDHLGKEELPEPSQQDEEIIDLMLADGPLTKPILREWER
jgi:radical SAM protein with 4Fe4S-binding SPASM domain